MKRRMNKRMAAATLAGAMVLSMNGMAWADPTTDQTTDPAPSPSIEEISFGKEVTADLNTYAPNTNFKFTLSNGTGGEKEFADEDAESGKVKINVLAGVNGGLYFGTKEDKKTESILSFTPGMSPDINKTEYNSYTNNEGKINVDVSVFESTGVYEYILQESQGSYDGITYDTQKIHIYVNVGNNDTDNGYKVLSVWSTDENDTTNNKLGELKFINRYGYGDTTDKIHDFTIKKTVSGNQGEKNKDFSFTVTINGDDEGKADKDKEKYKAVKTEKDGKKTSIEITEDTTEIFSLRHGETLHIYGLSEKDTYTVTETDYSAYGYTTIVKADVENDEFVNIPAIGRPGEDGKVLTADGWVVEFINDKHVGPATGVAMTFAPYVLLVAAAGGLGAVVLGKKKREDDEI